MSPGLRERPSVSLNVSWYQFASILFTPRGCIYFSTPSREASDICRDDEGALMKLTHNSCVGLMLCTGLKWHSRCRLTKFSSSFIILIGSKMSIKLVVVFVAAVSVSYFEEKSRRQKDSLHKSGCSSLQRKPTTCLSLWINHLRNYIRWPPIYQYSGIGAPGYDEENDGDDTLVKVLNNDLNGAQRDYLKTNSIGM